MRQEGTAPLGCMSYEPAFRGLPAYLTQLQRTNLLNEHPQTIQHLGRPTAECVTILLDHPNADAHIFSILPLLLPNVRTLRVNTVETTAFGSHVQKALMSRIRPSTRESPPSFMDTLHTLELVLDRPNLLFHQQFPIYRLPCLRTLRVHAVDFDTRPPALPRGLTELRLEHYGLLGGIESLSDAIRPIVALSRFELSIVLKRHAAGVGPAQPQVFGVLHLLRSRYARTLTHLALTFHQDTGGRTLAWYKTRGVKHDYPPTMLRHFEVLRTLELDAYFASAVNPGPGPIARVLYGQPARNVAYRALDFLPATLKELVVYFAQPPGLGLEPRIAGIFAGLGNRLERQSRLPELTDVTVCSSPCAEAERAMAALCASGLHATHRDEPGRRWACEEVQGTPLLYTATWT